MIPINDNKGSNIYDNKDLNKNTCSDNAVTRWYCFLNSNNGEIHEDELNYQTSKVDSKDMASTLARKIQARISSHY